MQARKWNYKDDNCSGVKPEWASTDVYNSFSLTFTNNFDNEWFMLYCEENLSVCWSENVQPLDAFLRLFSRDLNQYARFSHFHYFIY